MSMSNACLTCKHRGTVPNSVHSSCKHPRVNYLMGDHELLQLHLDRLINHEKCLHFADDLEVHFKASAIEAGWALWPFNFAPLWLVSCTGYDEGIK